MVDNSGGIPKPKSIEVGANSGGVPNPKSIKMGWQK